MPWISKLGHRCLSSRAHESQASPRARAVATGTTGLYPRPLGADPGPLPPSGFTIWTVRVPGKRPQVIIVMFEYTDKFATAAPSVFYVAADTAGQVAA
jgi:hypothetical protein